MNPYKIQLQLSRAIRNVSRMKEELSSERVSIVRRIINRIRIAQLTSRIRLLTAKLHTAS